MATPFTAALLAGGKSSRMGQDKARLEFEGQPLWKHQIRLLESLSPDQLLISGRSDGPYAGTSYRVLLDEEPGLGPLAGLATLLAHCTAPRLLVLAVDMPWMTRPVLETLLGAEKGLVPEHDGWWEGTAAVYPREILPLIQKALHGPDRSFQALVRQAADQGLLASWPVPAGLRSCFRSWNTPS